MKKMYTFALCLLGASLSAQVGIGTTSPTEALDVETNNGTKTAIDINNSSTGDPLIHFQVSGIAKFTIGVDNDDSDKLKIGTTAAETGTALTIDGSQNVGIGNTAPTATLDVDGSAIFNESHAAVDFRIEGDAETHLFFVDGSADKIGIGTSSPTYFLHIYNDDAATGCEPLIETNNTRWAGLQVKNTNRAWFTGIPSGGASRYAMVDNTAGQERVSINTSGYVGIAQTTPVSGLEINTSMGLKVTTITSATTLDNTHNVVLCNTGAYTVTLPAAASHTGKIYYIKNIDAESDDITIDGNGSEEIDGATTVVLYVRYDAIRIVSDGSNWHIIADERIAHKCVLTRDAVQSISTATATEISFDDEDTDVGEMGATGTGNSVTIQRAGEYLVNASWTSDFGDNNNAFRTYIYVNGVLTRTSQNRQSSGTTNTLLTTNSTYIATFAVGDYIDMYVYHTEGSAENTGTAVDEKPILSVIEIR